jgi:hypothetical protein
MNNNKLHQSDNTTFFTLIASHPEVEPDQVQRLLWRALELWPAVEQHLDAFDGWLQELKA